MTAPPKTDTDGIERVPGAGVDVVHRIAPDDIWRLWLPNEAFPRVVIDPQQGQVLTGNGAAPPAALGGGGGTVAVASGGTGDTSLAAHGLLIGAGTSPVVVSGAGTAGQVLTSNGAAADPTFQAAAGGAPSGAAGGDLAGTYPNPTLAAAGPGATGPLGTAARTPTVTIDAKGRVTALTDQAIAIPESAVTGLVADLAAKQPTTLTSAHLLVGNGSNVATDVAVTGDVTISNAGVTALKSTGPGATGPLGSATVVPVVTIDAQGRVTALTSATIVIPESAVTSLVSDLALKAPLASPALTGTPTVPTATAGDSSTTAASTAFVGTAVANALAGLDTKPDVAYVSLSALPANTYANGTAGVGATLTGNVNGPLVIDGVTLVVGQAGERVLVAAEATAANNGWYTITQVGVVAVSPYILTRATESDQAAEIGAGYLTGVVAPNTVTPGANNGKLFISVAADPFTVGTTSLTFSQVGGTYSAGTGLGLSGSTFSIDTAVTVDKTTAQTLTNKTLTSPVINTGVSGTAVDTDSTMAANSDTILASQKAIKTALALTAPLASPTFTGSPVLPSGVQFNSGTNQTAFGGYREGTFSPAIADQSAHTASLSNALGRYTRVGNRVFFTIVCVMTGKGSCVSTDQVGVTGLPYASENTAVLRHVCHVGAEALTTSVVYIEGHIAVNATQVLLYYRAAAATSESNLLISDLSTTTTIRITGHYNTSAAF